MKHKNSHLLVGYWSHIRDGRDVPEQGDIEPSSLKHLLSYTFILDCENLAISRPLYRLAGSSLCERFGFDLKGTSFLQHWDSQSVFEIASALRKSLQDCQPVCLSSIAATADNGMVELETTLTPVSNNSREPTRFFGLVQMLGDPSPLLGRTIAYEKLIASQFIEQEDPAPANGKTSPPLPTLSFKSHPKAPYLRLVISPDPPHISNV